MRRPLPRRLTLGAIAVALAATLPTGPSSASPPTRTARLDPYLVRAARLAPRLATPSARARAERDLRALARIVAVDLAAGPPAALVRVAGSLEPRSLARIGAERIATERVTSLVRVPLSSLRALATLPGVRFVESVALLHERLDVAVPLVGAAALHDRDPGLTGAGVVYGSIDSGIDVTHPTFLNPDGSTRIEAFWNVCDQSGLPPDGFDAIGGTLYLRDDIDAMLGGNAGRFRHQDVDGHGTMTAAIGAGSGEAGELAGMAPGAAIVVVALPFLGGQVGCANPILAFEGAITAVLTEAARFVETTAAGRPFVVNMSLGEHTGPHDGTSLLDSELEAIATAGPGRALVAAAGNEGAGVDPTGRGRSVGWVHGGAELPASGEPLALDATVAPPGPATVELWYPGDAEVEILLRQGEDCAVAVPTGTAFETDAFYVDNASEGPDVRNGDRPALVELYGDITPAGDAVACESACARLIDLCGEDPLGAEGTCADTCLAEWGATRVECVKTYLPEGARNPCRRLTRTCTQLGLTLEVRAASGRPVRIDAYATDFMTVLDAEGAPMTIGAPASSRGVIAAGALVHRDSGGSFPAQGALGDLTTYSSHGPMRDGRLKPEIAAPAELITSAAAAGSVLEQYGDGRWVTLNGGTSSASPGVAGAIALLLEAQPALELEQVYEALALGATVDDWVGAAPNDAWGWGKLQVEHALAAFDPERPDDDHDGFTAATAGGLDCDDGDDAIGPRQGERTGNAVDDDCDGLVDEPLPTTGFHASDDPWCGALVQGPDAGLPAVDAGVDAGPDGGASAPDAAPTGGGVAGGGCGCRAARRQSAGSRDGWALGLVSFAVLAARWKRRA